MLVAKRIERGRFMATVELKEISEITSQELKQIFNGGLIVRPKVERSFVTQVGSDLLSSGFVQRSSYEQGHQQSY